MYMGTMFWNVMYGVIYVMFGGGGDVQPDCHIGPAYGVPCPVYDMNES